MPSRIEDYALIGDCQTAALVGRDGSIDWLCLPRFDSPACFAALLGTPEHGRWLLAPVGGIQRTHRRYRGDTLVLETRFETDEGAASVIDFMPPRSSEADLVRIVEGKAGRVLMQMEVVLRFDYGSIVPWVQHVEGGITGIAGPDMVRIRSPIPFKGKEFRTVASFAVTEGARIPFDLTWFPSHQPFPHELDPDQTLHDTEQWWQEWADRCTYDGAWPDAVKRSLITLKALTYAPTGGIIAAPTTSLPEHLGGVRNWDYRYCWLRDATFTLYALTNAGYLEEARNWREWLMRAVAGTPSQVHIMYGIAGERRLPEMEIPWLPGYEGSRPVRIGNAAFAQLQLDVFGEIMDALHQCWRQGMDPGPHGWRLELALLEYLESAWESPDEGIWEVRGPRRHFTHSKVMAWVAMDRAIKDMERFGLDGPIDRWRMIRDRIHEDVCAKGFNPTIGSFVQSYGSDLLDASLLMIPLVGFLPPSDPRVKGTVDAIERGLKTNAFVARYKTVPEVDGLPEGESAFLLCSFWLADVLALMGKDEEARQIFEHLLAIRNDVGLLSESYDVGAKRLTGNFPQAFSHIGLINTARNLSRKGGPAEDRPKA